MRAMPAHSHAAERGERRLAHPHAAASGSSSAGITIGEPPSSYFAAYSYHGSAPRAGRSSAIADAIARRSRGRRIDLAPDDGGLDEDLLVVGDASRSAGSSSLAATARCRRSIRGRQAYEQGPPRAWPTRPGSAGRPDRPGSVAQRQRWRDDDFPARAARSCRDPCHRDRRPEDAGADYGRPIVSNRPCTVPSRRTGRAARGRTPRRSRRATGPAIDLRRRAQRCPAGGPPERRRLASGASSAAMLPSSRRAILADRNPEHVVARGSSAAATDRADAKEISRSTSAHPPSTTTRSRSLTGTTGALRSCLSSRVSRRRVRRRRVRRRRRVACRPG